MLMSYRIVLSTAAAVAMAIALQAQTATSKQANGSTPGEVTVTGCVERADQVGASGTAATTVDSLSFVLIHAVRGIAADRQVAGTSGTNSNKAVGGIYRLDSNVATLNPHVGHKVEVTGTVDGAAAATPPSADTTSAANAPRLKVARVKMVSETCDR
jgi:hypothetical protein